MQSQRTQKTQNQQLDHGLPHDLHAEQAIICALQLDDTGELLAIAKAKLDTSHFFYSSNRHIYSAILELSKENRAITPVSIADKLKDMDKLEIVGGLAYIAGTLDAMYLPTNKGFIEYVNILRSKSISRRSALRAENLRLAALDPSTSVEDLQHLSQEIAEVVSEKSKDKPLIDLSVLLRERLERAEFIAQHPEEMLGVATGFVDIDHLTCGLQPADLILLAARPSQGKTAFALNIADQVAAKGKSVAIFSLEMSAESLADRLLCASASVDLHRYRSGFMSKVEWDRLSQAQNRLATVGRPMAIEDSANLTVAEMSVRANLVKAKQGLDLIIVDYLQLLRGSEKAESRQQEVSAISRDLKKLAKEMNVPIIALSQLSRAPEQRADHRPQLSDLRESGSLEQDSDLVMFIYREEVYGETEENQGKAEIIIAKQRNGPTDTVQLAYIKQYTRFENLYRG